MGKFKVEMIGGEDQSRGGRGLGWVYTVGPFQEEAFALSVSGLDKPEFTALSQGKK